MPELLSVVGGGWWRSHTPSIQVLRSGMAPLGTYAEHAFNKMSLSFVSLLRCMLEVLMHLCEMPLPDFSISTSEAAHGSWWGSVSTVCLISPYFPNLRIIQLSELITAPLWSRVTGAFLPQMRKGRGKPLEEDSQLKSHDTQWHIWAQSRPFKILLVSTVKNLLIESHMVLWLWEPDSQNHIFQKLLRKLGSVWKLLSMGL